MAENPILDPELPEIPITDGILLDAVLKWFSKEQLVELCTSFDPQTPLGAALYARVDALEKEPEKDLDTFRKELIATATASEKFSLYFWKAVDDYMDRAGITPPQLYKAIGITQQAFSKRQEIGYQEEGKKIWESHTSSANALAICILLRLNLFELKNLMSSGGHSFDPSVSSRDYIVAKCIRKGLYDPLAINQLLEDSGMERLPFYLTLNGQLPKARKQSKKDGKKKEEPEWP